MCSSWHSNQKAEPVACEQCSKELKQYGQVGVLWLSRADVSCSQATCVHAWPWDQLTVCLPCAAVAVQRVQRPVSFQRTQVHKVKPAGCFRTRSFVTSLPPFLSRCVHSEKKYGPPVACDDCKLKCAFRKPEETRKKVNIEMSWESEGQGEETSL